MLTKIIVLLVLLIPTLAFAQRSSDAENCSKAEIYNNRGIAHESKGEHDLAIAGYNEAIRLNPKYAFAFNNLGIAHESKGEHDLAIADYNEAIRLNPKYAFAFNNRGIAHESKGEHDLAIADYRTRPSDSTRNMHLPLTTAELRTKVKVNTT